MEKNTSKAPVYFIGHGSPMNAINKNSYTAVLSKEKFKNINAVVVISAHYETQNGTFITSAQENSLIYDFYGFPEALYQLQYSSQGDTLLAKKWSERFFINIAHKRGLDHGAWSILLHLLPAAQIPILQVSIDQNKSYRQHFELGRLLGELRTEGVAIVASGNLVHNLGNFSWNENEPTFPWAKTFDEWISEKIAARDLDTIFKKEFMHPLFKIAHPRDEHFIPLLYALGASAETDTMTTLFDEIHHGSIAMRSLKWMSGV